VTSLTGQHALITGAGSGVGKCIAQALSANGARVTAVGRRAQPLQEVVGGLQGAIALPVDVSDEAQVAAMLDAAREAHGPVDVLIANAGAAESAPLAKTTLQIWNAMLAVNLTGVFLCARGVLPDMLERGSGRIVNVASTAGLKGYPYVSAYCAAKHGVVGFTRALAVETARSGVTVNAICPGFTDTPLLHRSIEEVSKTTGRTAEEVRATFVRSNPQGRFITPQEVADTALWLLSPGAASITGQAVAVAGGEV
jgi:NAD(P)-dependent dehydrogenase (short-subunit alcohol dehydrogenase family)